MLLSIGYWGTMKQRDNFHLMTFHIFFLPLTFQNEHDMFLVPMFRSH